MSAAEPTTQGTLLGGRVRYDQFRTGYRTGIEPVFLAAFVPARPGQHVLEAGSGAGAALLCLATRVAGIVGTGLEQDAALVGLATANAAANDLSGLRFVAGTLAPDYQLPGAFDHVMANPPWHPDASTASPDPGRARAKRASPASLRLWTVWLAAKLKPSGTLSLILPTAALVEAMVALQAAGLGRAEICPLWPRAGQPAKLMLVGATKGQGPARIGAGLVLHQEDGQYTAAANEVLRGLREVGRQGQGSAPCLNRGDPPKAERPLEPAIF